MYLSVNLIVDDLQEHKYFNNILEHLKAHYNIKPNVYKATHIFKDENYSGLFLLFLSDEDIKYFLAHHIGKKMNIAIIPNSNALMAVKKYGISKDIFEAIDDAFNANLASSVDVMTCNELVVFNRVTIGDMHGFDQLDVQRNSIFSKVGTFFSNVLDVDFKKYTLITQKEQEITTVALGITAVDTHISTKNATIHDDLSMHDGKLNAFILSPTSMLSYLWYLIAIFFYQKLSLVSLPKSLGFLKVGSLNIKAKDSIDFRIDGQAISAQSIELTVVQDAITLHLGRNLKSLVKDDTNEAPTKDTIRLSLLPVGEVQNLLMEQRLPLFKKASNEEFKDLFVSLRASAKFTYSFLILMVLSTLIATTGLFANSAPVIIGAMILAPLMSPIVSLAMGVVRAERTLMGQSLKTLIIGVLMAVFFAFLVTFILPLDTITPEMQSRLNPNLLDLMVAIFSGMAGAYAASKEEVAKSLAGVAIAVALVPPLGVTGIGIGMGNIDVVYGSFLLFLANLLGMTLSAALTFVVLGYAPVTKATKGVLYSFILMAIVAVPLVLSFQSLIQKNSYMNALKFTQPLRIEDKSITIEVEDVVNKTLPLRVRIQAISNTQLDSKDYKIIKQHIQSRLNKEVVLEVIPKIVVY